MVVTELVTNYPECLRSQADEEGLTRSPGLHLSTIIRSIEQTIKPRNEWCTPEELAFFGTGGFMWERVFSMAHADAASSGDLIRPGEIELDGIAGSPDLLRLSDVTVLETKMSWRSAKKLDLSTPAAARASLECNFWSWLVQTKGYCHMIGTTHAEIHVFFVCGNWRPPVPIVKSVAVEYTEKELKQNWRMIIDHARDKGWI